MRTAPAPALSCPSSFLESPPAFHPLPAGHPAASELLKERNTSQGHFSSRTFLDMCQKTQQCNPAPCTRVL